MNLVARTCLGLFIALLTFGASTAVSYVPLALARALNVNHIVVDQLANGRPRFTPTIRGCGDGYSQQYQTDNGEWLIDGVVDSGTQEEFIKDVSRRLHMTGAELLQRGPSRSRDGVMGERSVWVLHNEHEQRVLIFWTADGDGFRFIEADTLEIALEIKGYLSLKDRS